MIAEADQQKQVLSWQVTTQAFKKRIYEVRFRTDFVLQPSKEIKNQVWVSCLNSIYNLIQEARSSNYLDERLFLIAREDGFWKVHLHICILISFYEF